VKKFGKLIGYDIISGARFLAVQKWCSHTVSAIYAIGLKTNGTDLTLLNTLKFIDLIQWLRFIHGYYLTAGKPCSLFSGQYFMFAAGLWFDLVFNMKY
jgi:hypothetical protein